MKAFKYDHLTWLIFAIGMCALMLLAAGCAPMPALDTPGKRVAAFEISLQEVYKVAIQERQEGLLSDSQIATLDKGFVEINKTRELAYAAWYAGRNADFDTHMNSMVSVLGILRSIVMEVQPNGKQ